MRSLKPLRDEELGWFRRIFGVPIVMEDRTVSSLMVHNYPVPSLHSSGLPLFAPRTLEVGSF